MTDWAALHDAYGSAADVPELLARVAGANDDDAWFDLWSRLCHQGTVYSASFAALPELLAIAQHASGAARFNPRHLAGAIVASADVQGSRADLARDLPSLLPRFDDLATSTLRAGASLREIEFVYLMEATLAFREVVPWNTQLNYFADGERPARCAYCAAEILVAVDEQGPSVTLGSNVEPTDASPRLSPPDSNHLPPIGRWMHETARTAEHEDLASRLLHLFATGSCPACKREGSVDEWVAAEVASEKRPE